MRENRSYGSEGGGTEINQSFLPLSECGVFSTYGKIVTNRTGGLTAQGHGVGFDHW